MDVRKWSSVASETTAEMILSLIVPIQCSVLRLFGLLPSGGNNCQVVCRIIGGVLLLAGWAHLILFYSTGVVSQLNGKLTSKENKGRFSPVVYIVQETVFIAMNARALLIISLFYFDQSLLRRLFAGSKRFLIGCFNSDITANHKYYRKWSLLGIGLFVVFAWAMIGWEIFGWIKNHFNHEGGFMVWIDVPAFPSLTGKVSNLGELCMWCLGNTLPFGVSVQLWICFVVFTVMLSDSVQVFVHTLEKGVETSGDGDAPLSRVNRGKKVTELIRDYEAIADFNDCLNSTMGLTFWLLYYLDLFTILGQVTGFTVPGQDDTLWDTAENVLGGVIWLSFLMLMMRPCMKAHETAQEIPKILYVQLVNSIPTLDGPEGEEYVSAITALMNTSRARTIMMNGNGLLMGTRPALVAVFYFIGTFIIIFDEIIEVMPHTD
ncbi:hypothetical protein BV898_17683 [Hypsibius exemplaris]|uniref:Gustatory receptor n=1 Tax=Hypsibius exemplaris TaxID=2072580 RepID=A0A9X6NHP5_HYPEX|nr:hypothetical protein BV898_17683 [Hypsibius exemplaris]